MTKVCTVCGYEVEPIVIDGVEHCDRCRRIGTLIDVDEDEEDEEDETP